MDLQKGVKAIDAICASIVNARYESFNQAILWNAKLRILDVLGCAVLGSTAAGNDAFVDLVRQWGGKTEATVLAYGGKVPVQHAALANSTLARSFDYEALGPLVEGRSIPAHLSGTTVPTALAMGETCCASGKELLTALLVGDDFASRVLAASDDAGLPLGWDHVGTVNTFGAAAIAGRMLGLDALQLRHAFGHGLNMMAGTMQNIWDGSPTFRLLQGTASKNGIIAAQLAQAGWIGPEDALLGRHAYYDLFTQGCRNPEILTKDLGKVFYSDAHFKPHPCCAAGHSAIDSALTVVEQHAFNPDDVKKIVLAVPGGGLKSYLALPLEYEPDPHTKAIFSYRYHVASAIIRKSFKPEHFSEKAVRDKTIRILAEKIELALLSDPNADLLSTSLKVILNNGREFEVFTPFPKGEPKHNPMSREEIIDKFNENLSYSGRISKERGEQAAEMLLSLEKIENLNDIVPLLVQRPNDQ